MSITPKNVLKHPDFVPESAVAGRLSAPPIALTIAGFDPSSGAGMTADLKTFAAHGVYGVSCVTALTVQSTQGVRRSMAVDPGLVSETLACLAEDVEIAGIKIGMLATAGVASAVADFLAQARLPKERIVLDPILRSSSGASLLEESGIHVLRERLLGQVGWITPNLDELAVLTGVQRVERESIPEAALQLREVAHVAGNDGLSIVVTGGHMVPPDDYVLLSDRSQSAKAEVSWIRGEVVDTTSTHGTGCAFSSALLCGLLNGLPDFEAVAQAKKYVTEALRSAYPVGNGRGPMNHFHRFGPTPTEGPR